MTLFQSNQEFLDAFNIGESTDYYEPILLSDTKFGFSIKRKYPDSIAFKPALKQNGDSDTVAVLWIVLRDKAELQAGKFLLTARISAYSLWSTNHFEYDESNPDSPTAEAVEKSKKTPRPVDLEYRDDFYYDSKNKVFLDKKNRPISGESILNYVFQEHCDTTHKLKGFELQFKNFVRKFFQTVLASVIWSLKFILAQIFRTKVIAENSLSELFDGYKDIEKTETETLDVFGYKASKSTIILFSVIISTLCYLKYEELVELKYFKYISADNFLVVVHSIVALAIIEIIPQAILLRTLNQLIKLKAKLSFMEMDPFSYKRWLLPLIIYCILIFLLYVSFTYLSNAIVNQ